MLLLWVLYGLALLLFRCGKCVPETNEHRRPTQQDAAQDTARTENKMRSDPTMDSLNVGEDLGIQNAEDVPSKRTSVLHPRSPGNTPCIGDLCGAHQEMLNIFAVLRGGRGSDGDLGSSILSRFGVCMDSDGPSRVALVELAKATKNSDQTYALDVLQPRKEPLQTEGEGIVLTLDLPHSPLLKLKPTLLLVLGSPQTPKELGVTFSSQSLHPDTQDVCVSGETQYIVLSGKASESEEHQSHKLRLLIESKNSDSGQKLRQILTDGGPGSHISITPLLLFWLEQGADTRLTQEEGASPSFSGTFSFFYELQMFLSDVSPQTTPEESTSVRLQALESLPPLALGLSSSQTLLLTLLNSSAPTLFSFPAQGSVLRLHRGALALSPALLEILRLRLEEAAGQMEEVMREEEEMKVEEAAGDHRALERLRGLRALCAFPTEEAATGELQYRAFLLLKALQTVVRTYRAQRALRTTRAGEDAHSVGASTCRLQSLTVSLEKFFVGPNMAAINNCGGSCGFPLQTQQSQTTTLNNHAYLLNAQIQLQRPLCCVPVAYEGLQVVELNEEGTQIYIKPDMVAKECDCR